jgi:rhodanese-related sulfurtransferase
MHMTTPPCPARRLSRLRPAAILLLAFFALGPAFPARAEPAGAAPTSWDDAKRLTPEELAKTLRTAGAEKPALFHVGFKVLFLQAHIPGSTFAGPGASPAGLDAVRKAAAAFPKSKPIVLYCGCCPWERCPNMEQPWRALVAAGFTNVAVLYIPKNFGQDWVSKGYPTESGEGPRG